MSYKQVVIKTKGYSRLQTEASDGITIVFDLDAKKTIRGDDPKVLIPFHSIDRVISTQIAEDRPDRNPYGCSPQMAAHFVGVNDATIQQGDPFDLTDGVSAIDADGSSVPFDVTPSTIDTCDVGAQTFTYTADGVGSKTRVITVTAIADPTISGISETIEVGTSEEFDPLDGVTAVDGKGDTVTVTVVLLP